MDDTIILDNVLFIPIKCFFSLVVVAALNVYISFSSEHLTQINMLEILYNILSVNLFYLKFIEIVELKKNKIMLEI